MRARCLGLWLWASIAAAAEPSGVKVVARDGTSGPLPWPHVEIEVDLGRTQLAVVAKVGGATLPELAPAAALVTVNGGYFDEEFRPIGWLRDASKEHRKRGKPKRGGVLALKGERAFVGTLGALPYAPEMALWSFPLLVNAGASGMRGDDGREAARTVACIREKKLVFILITTEPHSGPTLFKLADRLVLSAAKGGVGCTAALNLDGGPSTGVVFGEALAAWKKYDHLPMGKIAHGLAVLPK